MKKDMCQKTVLPNGVRLLMIPLEGVNSVSTSVMVGVGSRFETTSINGISHFLEHIVFKGTKKFPTTEDVNEIERIGGIQNAYTDVDVTNYHNKVLSTDWSQALEVNKELALMPLIENQHIDRERDVILEEMKRYEDEPAQKVVEVLHRMMYPGTPLGMRIIGESGSLKQIGASQLKAYHKKWYRSDNIVVVVAGKLVTSDKTELISKTNEWFGNLNGKVEEKVKLVTDDQKKPKVDVLTKPDAQQAHLAIGLRTFKRPSEERYAWNVFNLLMGISFTSRLFKEIREKRGLCYHIRSNSSNWKDVGYWNIYAGVATTKAEEAVGAIVAELAKAVDQGVTESEVKVAAKRLKTMLAFKAEDPEFINEYYGRQEVFNQEIVSLDDYVARIDKVTSDEINKLVKKYIVTETLNLALVWSKPENSRLEKLLKI
ncbi:M16 family metallopeptidase [Patescibacteria group bacterium]